MHDSIKDVTATTTGIIFECKDCRTFISAETLEYAMAQLEDAKYAGYPQGSLQYGVCRAILQRAAIGTAELLISTWEEATTLAYPVEGVMSEYTNNMRKWDKSTFYGAKRWRLVDHCIAECERLLSLIAASTITQEEV